MTKLLSRIANAGGFEIPASVSVASMLIYGMQHNREVFKPERFLTENSKQRHSFAFIPFSAGPINYLGKFNEAR